jgi:hypothetical protein
MPNRIGWRREAISHLGISDQGGGRGCRSRPGGRHGLRCIHSRGLDGGSLLMGLGGKLVRL